MIFVQNKTGGATTKLGVALGVEKAVKTVPDEKLTSLGKVEQNTNRQVIKKENKTTENFVKSGLNIISSKNRGTNSFFKNRKNNNYIIKLKNNMILPLNVPGCTPYDPYLINVCKKAIVEVKDELPNYKEIISKINTEFGIEEGKRNIVEVNADYFKYNNTTSSSFHKKRRTLLENVSDFSNKANNTSSFFKKNNNNNSKTNDSEKKSPLNKGTEILVEFGGNINKNICKEKDKDSKIVCNIKNQDNEKNQLKRAATKSISSNSLVNCSKEKSKIDAIKAKRKQTLKNSLIYLYSNGITVQEYVTKRNDTFPQKPFELRGSEEFFKSIKFNNYELVEQAIIKSRKYIDQYDYLKQTPFHWAAKLGYDKILDLLLKYSKRCNIYDKKMRTPLYIAALNNQKRCVELLLEKGANPYIYDKEGKKPEEVTTNTDIKIIIQTTAEKSLTELIQPNNNNNKKTTHNNYLMASMRKK